jgi:SAM-dependent methyltransferase
MVSMRAETLGSFVQVSASRPVGGRRADRLRVAGEHGLGIDLAPGGIEAARDFAKNAGVANIAFEPIDLAHLPAGAGPFDYIIAHGVYSWIPKDARDALLALIGRDLAPQGVAFVSYNTYPECHIRGMMWELLKFHTDEIDDPDTRVREAQALIRLVAHGNTQADEYTQPLVAEALRMEYRHPAISSTPHTRSTRTFAAWPNLDC